MTESRQWRFTEITPHFWGKSIKFKILTLLSVIIVLSLSTTTLLGIHTTNKVIMESSHTKLTSELSIGLSLMENQYNGNWRLLSGKLWKGDMPINGRNNIAALLSSEIGDMVTIYQGNKAIATSFKNSHGEYLTGGTIPVEIQQTLKKGNTYIGQQMIDGQKYEVAYQPIQDNDNRLIGVWSLASPLNQLLHQQTIYQYESVLITVIVLILGLAIGIYVTNRMIRPLKKLIGIAREIGNGNLDVLVDSLNSDDEIGQLGEVVNQMTRSLRNVINELASTALKLSAASDQFHSSAQETNKAAEQVALTIQETAISVNGQAEHARDSMMAMEDMSRSVHQIAKSAQSVTVTAVTAADVAQKGNESVKLAVAQINSVGESIEGLAHSVNNLGQRSKEIERIVDVITQISTQTNLLSLNAAIEAARAGEYGRGFAVVASEVRKLAEQSSKATGQVADFISTLQGETEQAVKSMLEAQMDVRNGVEAVNTAGIAFGQIQEAVKHVANQILEVSSGAQQLSATSVQVLESIRFISESASYTAESTDDIAASAQEQSASMQEVAASANGLSDMASQMQKLVARFHY